MTLHLLAVGKLKSAWARDACGLYQQRIKRYAPFDITEIRDAVSEGAPERASEVEGARIVGQLSSRDWPVALDVTGTMYASEKLAAWLDRRLADGVFRTVFIIGGPFGLSPPALARCRERLSLSALTLPHELCRVVFLEQLYRAFTIIRGEQYHHG